MNLGYTRVGFSSLILSINVFFHYLWAKIWFGLYEIIYRCFRNVIMLKSLYIRNYALIDKLEVDFHPGFSVVTGETGAGKSIILGALALILGQRADSKSIKVGEKKCVIEGIFDVNDFDLKDFCERNDIEFDPDSFILRREISAEGKSRAFINDSPVSLTVQKELAEKLIDVHSQHKNLLLGDGYFQLEVLDLLAGSGGLFKKFQDSFKYYKATERKLAALREAALNNKNEEEFLRFQHEALASASLKDGEQEELEAELSLLNHAEDIKSSLFKVFSLLSEDEQNVVGCLKEALQTLQSISGIYTGSKEYEDRIQSSYLDLKDLASELEKTAEDIEFSSERFEFINARLDLIYGLEQKHHLQSIAELIELHRNIGEKLAGMESMDESIELVAKELDANRKKMLDLSGQLSSERRKAKSKIEKALVEKIVSLGMPNARFECSIAPKKLPDITGGDDLQFLFSANKNVPLQPIADVASGGEISRVMLCLKSMIAAESNLPTLIFDEIDTGVSGEIADKMGKIMQEFGQSKQVLAITHLPQIASRGNYHYFVYKSDDQHTSNTQIKLLTTEERTKELAQMLSGAQITDAAIENAKQLLFANSK